MNRREFLIRIGGLPWLVTSGAVPSGAAIGANGPAAGEPHRAAAARGGREDDPERREVALSGSERSVTLFLCGDVMTGRGIDQALSRSVDPQLHEPAVRDANQYVRLAEAANGPIPRPVDPSYVWGEALDELERVAPDARVINLETAVTTSDRHAAGKGVHYRMHPENVACITAAGIDCCVLANNHVADWGTAGLEETLVTLEEAGLETAGAGLALGEARAPAVLELMPEGDPVSSGEASEAEGEKEDGGRRVLVFGLGSTTSGIPPGWRASEEAPGVALLDDLSTRSARRVARRIRSVRRAGDVVVVSIHWGGNWGYRVPERQREFAHTLVDRAGVDVVHGHSSHHAKGVEVYGDRPILYGCGDFINDYEGISGHRRFRGDLAVMYLPTVDPDGGGLQRLDMTPFQIRRFRLHRASREDAEWLRETLDREGERFGTGVELRDDGRLSLVW